jgi:signal transduction histidine kinase
VFVDDVDEQVLANLAGSTEHAASLRAVQPRTFITVPLFGRGQVIGAFTFGMSVSSRRYTQDDVELAEELGRRAGMAIENALLFREAVDARQRAESAEQRMARLQATTASLARVMSPAEAGLTVLEQGLGMFGAEAGSLYVLAGDELHALSWLRRDQPPAMISLATKYPIAHVVRTGESLFINDREALATRFPEVSAVMLPNQQAAIVLPMIVEGRVIGAIGLNFMIPRTFSAEERRFADAMASQAALAIDRALLIERDRARANRAAFLDEASELLAGSLERERVLADLTRLVVPRFADWCAVELVDGESTKQVAVAHVDPSKVAWAIQLREKYPPDRAQQSGVYHVIRTGKPEIYPTVALEMLEAARRSDEHFEILKQLAIRSAMIVPLVASGKPIGAITLVWAESGHHYTQSDLDLFTELAHRAALAVENSQLYLDLQHAVQVRDDFLAAAGHELKTPLAALLMQVQSMQRQLEKNIVPTNMVQRLEKAARAGTRLERLIDELLDVSRITAGRLHLEPAAMQLDELVHEVVERFVDQAASAGCTITVEAAPVTGIWDRARIDQVVSNLVGNALKYGRGHSVEVNVAARNGDAVLRIVDHGIGIAAGEQQKIFERFERAVQNRDFGGFGLGLWIARQIVEASGGTIEVDSSPGEGATFTVMLPRGDA